MILVLSLFLVFSSLHQANAMGLKQNVILKDSFIKLGDIFYDLPANQDKILGTAPRPGSELVLNASTLLRVARALDLPWRPTSSADYVVLRRAATLLEHGLIEKTLKKKITEEGFSGNFQLAFDQGKMEIILPEDQPAKFDILKLNVDFKADRFQADIAAPSKDNPIQTSSITGSIERLVEVPVLKEALRNGAVLSIRDIDFVDMPEYKINHDVILDAEDLVGMTPRRMIMATKPITERDIEAPMLVQRGQTVTMVFESGSLFLTAQGRALQNGAKGDLIRVVNDNSSRTVTAMIAGDQEVRVVE